MDYRSPEIVWHNSYPNMDSVVTKPIVSDWLTLVNTVGLSESKRSVPTWTRLMLRRKRSG